MQSELDKLYKEFQILSIDAETLLTQTQNQNIDIKNHLSAVMDEYYRVTKLSGQAGYVLDKLDLEFQEKTRLHGWEIVLLFTCVAIQCIRQYLLPNDKGRISATQGDALMEDTIGGMVKPQWQEVLFQSVPYDAIKTGIHVSNTGIAGTTHRYRTLGHDPILGWVFGTANIMTNSLTKYNLVTYQVKDMTIVRHYPLGVGGMLSRAGEYSVASPKLLVASLARQIIHFGSDFFTKQGLPVPIISTLNNDLAKDMLTKWNIDTYSIIRGMGLSAFINKLIFIIHQFFYNEKEDGSRELYEVRTRKILSYSNLIATGSNIIVTAVTRDGKLLDLGGLIVTIIRLVSDYRFIHRIKREFLQNGFEKAIVGDKYDFL